MMVEAACNGDGEEIVTAPEFEVEFNGRRYLESVENIGDLEGGDGSSVMISLISFFSSYPSYAHRARERGKKRRGIDGYAGELSIFKAYYNLKNGNRFSFKPYVNASTVPKETDVEAEVGAEEMQMKTT
ncbi:uncharacterized protein A4U43_C08F12270 [Asparagus officinalis]|nr:uncharacterized protein A4U43_C08F12270 [Asparagus officinalis]